MLETIERRATPRALGGGGAHATADATAAPLWSLGATGSPLEGLSTTPSGAGAARAHAALKRALDVTVSLSLLLLLLPLALIVAVAIKVESPGPVFYRARRVGRGGRPFDMFKFRKMRDDAVGLPLTMSEDDRFTRVGAVLTKTKLDELPQLLNVLRGEMSLVGPRPEDQTFVELHPERFDRILMARPGITGLSQLAFAAENEILDATDPIGHYCRRILPQKMALDEMYSARSNAWVDLYVLIWTGVAVALRRPVAVCRATGQMRIRHRP